jgi:hypothetical protein
MWVHRNSGDFESALGDFARAQELEALSNLAKKTSSKDTKGKPSTVEISQQLKRPVASTPQIWGQMLTLTSISEAHLAKDEADRLAILKDLDEAEKRAQPISTEDFQFFVTFDKERYFLDCAQACVESPIKKLRSSTKAKEYLAEVQKESAAKGKSVNAHRQVDNDVVQARIYCDKERYLVAATTAEQALLTLKELESKVCLGKIATLFAEIKERAPLEIEVMSLEAELMKAQQPYLFA